MFGHMTEQVALCPFVPPLVLVEVTSLATVAMVLKLGRSVFSMWLISCTYGAEHSNIVEGICLALC